MRFELRVLDWTKSVQTSPYFSFLKGGGYIFSKMVEQLGGTTGF